MNKIHQHNFEIMKKLVVILLLFLHITNFCAAQGFLNDEYMNRFYSKIISAKEQIMKIDIDKGNLIDFNYKNRKKSNGLILLRARWDNLSCILHKSSTASFISIQIDINPDMDNLLDHLSNIIGKSDIVPPNDQSDIIKLYQLFEKQGLINDGVTPHKLLSQLYFSDLFGEVLATTPAVFCIYKDSTLGDCYTLTLDIGVSKNENYDWMDNLNDKFYIIPNQVDNVSFVFEGNRYKIPLFQHDELKFDLGYQFSNMKWIAEIPEDYYQYVK